MKKSVRLFALVAAMTFAAAPSMHANQMGTNPHPQVTTAAPGTWAAFVYTVRSYFGV